MPTLNETVERTPGKPRKIISDLTFFPGDEENVRNADMIASIPEHWDPNNSTLTRPDPDDDSKYITVYIEAYDKDNSDPAAKKRHSVLVERL